MKSGRKKCGHKGEKSKQGLTNTNDLPKELPEGRKIHFIYIN